MLIVLCFSLSLLYLGAVGFLFYSWNRIERPGAQETLRRTEAPFVSVIVVVRNEAMHIRNLLSDLDSQDFNSKGYEVMVVDDHSSDKTADIVREMKAGLSFKLRLIKLTNGFGKKAGLEEGISLAAGEVILVTDGDCRLPAGWISSMASSFLRKKAAFVSGPVTFSAEEGLFEKMQTVEFASLVGSGAALLESGWPAMCNAANMGFRREVFQEVGGYSRNRHIPSGDDEFLLQAVYQLYPQQVFYLKDPKAVVHTRPQVSYAAFYHQRKRWAGKWRLHKKPAVALSALALFAFYASWLFLAVAMLVKGLLLFFFAAALLKFAFEYLFLRSVLQSFNKKLGWSPFIILQLIYPFYVLFFGLAVNFGSFKWKGRTYKYKGI